MTICHTGAKAKAMLEARVKALESKVATRQQGSTAADAAAGDAIAAGEAETGTEELCVAANCQYRSRA